MGCADSDGYIHDAQCVVYTGPDTRYQGSQICFGFNEDTLTIYDVTDKSNPKVIFRLGYQGSVYTHQGWLNADMTSLLLNDELDEQRGTTIGQRTRTYVWDISDLENAFENAELFWSRPRGFRKHSKPSEHALANILVLSSVS